MKQFTMLLLSAALSLPGCKPADPADSGQDFALLAQAADGFARAQPGTVLEFPRDHGPHPDFRIEWWYLTANLAGDDGRTYGAQWTLFRTAVLPPGSIAAANTWQSEQVYMAHFALTGPDSHSAFQRYARGAAHQDAARSGVTAQPFAAWLDDWTLGSEGSGFLPLEVRARQQDHAMQLLLESDRPLVLQGDEGYSRKHPDGGGSYYYSQPFLKASGELTLAGRTVKVRGEAWLDREWSSQFLQPDQEGWDWFALHLDSGEKLMLFRLRGAKTDDGPGPDFHHGVLIEPDGAKRALDPARIDLRVVHTRAVAGRQVPLGWRILLPEIDRDLTVRALHPDQWMDLDFPYWEGVIIATGEGPGNSGRGYLELTGYSR
jgi:predicted secreted hydrolase